MAAENQDIRYYRTRLFEERERALQAASPEASAAHRALADMYQRQLDHLAGQPEALPG